MCRQQIDYQLLFLPLKILNTKNIFSKFIKPIKTTIISKPNFSVNPPPNICPPTVPRFTNIIKIANIDAEILGSLKLIATAAYTDV